MAASGAELGGNGLSNLGNRTLLQLRDLAKRIGLGGYSRMDKTGLLEAVSEALPRRAPAAVALGHEAVSSTSAPSTSSGASELPSHITFLPRDPQWAYVFWEISASVNSALQKPVPPSWRCGWPMSPVCRWGLRTPTHCRSWW